MATTVRNSSSSADSVGSRGAGAEHGRARSIVRRGTLPNGRAITGALLVVVAVLGLFVAYRSSTLIRTVDYLVARRDVPAGRVITVDDLALAPMVLYAGSATHAFRQPEDVLGKVALVPMSTGALVERQALADAASSTPGRRLSVELEPSQALNGRLEVGDRVDIVSAPTGEVPASILERDSLVTAVDGLGEGGVEVGGSSARVTVTLAVPGEDAARAIIDARAHGTITLIASSQVTLDASPDSAGER